MRGKTGAARLALATGAPVVPVVMWGPEQIFDPRTTQAQPAPAHPGDRRRRAADRPEPVGRAPRRPARRSRRSPTHIMLRAARHARRDPRRHAAAAVDAGRRPRRDAPRPEELSDGRDRISASPCSAPARGAPRSPRSSPTPAATSIVWARREAVAAAHPGRAAATPTTCPTLRLPERVTATADAAEALDGAELVVLAVPSQTAARQPRRLGRRTSTPTPRWSRLMKGIELGTTKRMSEVIVETAGVDRRTGWPSSPGPTWRREIAAEQPAATVVAVHRHRPGRRWCSTRSRTPYFRPYTNDDVIGCELGGAVKNVIALAYGMATGDGLRRQHQGDADHPRAGRDRPAGRARSAPTR